MKRRTDRLFGGLLINYYYEKCACLHESIIYQQNVKHIFAPAFKMRKVKPHKALTANNLLTNFALIGILYSYKWGIYALF